MKNDKNRFLLLFFTAIQNDKLHVMIQDLIPEVTTYILT